MRHRHARVPSHSGGVKAWLYDNGPDTPAVAVAHGSGSAPREYFATEARILADLGLTVLVAAKDTAGYGLVRRDYDVLADDLGAQVAWLRNRGHERVGVLGFSEGTWVATIAAARGGVDAVALCSAPIVDAGDQTAHEYLVWWPRRWPGRERVHAGLQRVLRRLMPYLRRSTDAELASLRMPVVAVWGSDDPIVDVPRAIEASTRLCPQGRRHVVEGTGHSLRADQEEWLALVADVLAGRDGLT